MSEIPRNYCPRSHPHSEAINPSKILLRFSEEMRREISTNGVKVIWDEL